MATQQRRLTLEEFLEKPEQKPALEYIDGVVTQKPLPKARHSLLQYHVCERVNHEFAGSARLALALPELGCTFAGASVVPDVAVFLWERVARDPSGEPVDDVYEPPDIAVEIVSPEQSATAVAQRCRWYVENGVRVALLVNPVRERSVGVFRPRSPEDTPRGDGQIDVSDILPGFRPTVRELFDSRKLG